MTSMRPAAKCAPTCTRSSERCLRNVVYVLALAFVALATLSAGAAPVEPTGYYERKEEGWWWKKKVPLPPLPELVEPTPPLAEQPPTPQAPEPVPDAGPEPFTPAWLREKLPELRDRAMADPTPQNVRAYFYLQRYATDMASRFAYTAQRVVLADPVLDGNTRRPRASAAAQALDRRANEAVEALARKIAGEVGVWYFYRSDCPFCAQQNPVLKRLEDRLGLAILPVALDGRPMPDGNFERFVPDNGHAESLGVEVTPTLFLVKKPDQFVLLSAGIVAAQDLMERMVLAAHTAGWITDAEYRATRHSRQQHMVPLEAELVPHDLDDPEALMQHLRATMVEEAL